MQIKAKELVFVGTSIDPGQEECEKALQTTLILKDQGFVPVSPLVYCQLFPETPEDHAVTRLSLLGGCRFSIWTGEPTDDEKELMARLGITSPKVGE